MLVEIKNLQMLFIHYSRLNSRGKKEDKNCHDKIKRERDYSTLKKRREWRLFVGYFYTKLDIVFYSSEIIHSISEKDNFSKRK